MREAGQGRNPAALSDFRCVLFFCVEEDLWPNLVFLKIKRVFLLVLSVRRQCIWICLAWFVGDLAQLPLREHSIDVILDIFSPANYQEFGRLLSDYGLVFKVIPHEDHLKEFRQLLPEVQAYSNQDVLEHFQESCDLLERVTIAKTWFMPSEHVQTFAEMTPLFFHANKDTLDLTSVTQLTVAGELLIGRIRDDKQS